MIAKNGMRKGGIDWVLTKSVSYGRRERAWVMQLYFVADWSTEMSQESVGGLN